MKRFDDDHETGMPAADEATIEDLARLTPAAPSTALRGRIAVALDAPQVPVKPAGRRAWWIVERMLWAGGGAIAAAVPLLLQARPTPDPAVAVGQPAVETDPTPAPDSGPVTEAAAAPIMEESLAWSDDGVQFIDGQIPARVIRHWVLERFPGADGEGLVRPREDVFVVPVALR